MTTVKELEDYCRKYGIKNFSELNKKELEEKVNKHKREHDKWGRKIGNTYRTVKR